MAYISLTSILGASILLSCATWLRLLMGLMKSPKSKIMKLSDRSSRLNENSLYGLKKEVNLLSITFYLKTKSSSLFRLVNYHTSSNVSKPFSILTLVSLF